MAKKYVPVASLEDLERVEQLINSCIIIDDLKEVLRVEGQKVGYKAFCYMFTGKMNAKELKAEAAQEAVVATAPVTPKVEDQFAYLLNK